MSFLLKMYFVAEINDKRTELPMGKKNADGIALLFDNIYGWTKRRCFDYVCENGEINYVQDNELTKCDTKSMIYRKYLLAKGRVYKFYALASRRKPFNRLESFGRYVLEMVVYMRCGREYLIVRDTNVTLRGLCIERYRRCLGSVELPDDLRESVSKNEH